MDEDYEECKKSKKSNPAKIRFLSLSSLLYTFSISWWTQRLFPPLFLHFSLLLSSFPTNSTIPCYQKTKGQCSVKFPFLLHVYNVGLCSSLSGPWERSPSSGYSCNRKEKKGQTFFCYRVCVYECACNSFFCTKYWSKVNTVLPCFCAAAILSFHCY